MVGRRYSEATAEWHNAQAGLMSWKAKKGREEVPVRMKNNGKPWWESDLFESKLSRAWARRLAGKPAAAAQPQQTGGGEMPLAEDDLPFAFVGDTAWRAPRWERW
jgi:hypothetical protein